MNQPILVIDQGTTSSRAILFSSRLEVMATAQQEFSQYFPAPGLVEHDPEELWASVIAVARDVIAKAGVEPAAIAAIGLTNQRETVVVWDRVTGLPIHRAIVWQDRRTTDVCDALREEGHEAHIAERSGLLIDPYFSATKIAWILDNVPGARARAEAGELACGTVDSFLLWRLTGGATHATDATNASRTQLLNIHTGQWDESLLALFRVPAALLPDVRDSAGDFGCTTIESLGAAIPLRGVAGDQQAALIGQDCLSPGMVKATYGTGGFVLLNTGKAPVRSRHRLLTTIAYQLGGQRTYALEGSIFIAGAALQWLRDGLGVIARAQDADDMAAQAADAQLYMVPAFVGLAAPDWRPEARGAIFGLTRATGPNDLVRAALESICFQTHDLLQAMSEEWEGQATSVRLRVDGGVSASNWMLQRLADTLAMPIDRPQVNEATALGAAWLARRGLSASKDDCTSFWRLDRSFESHVDKAVSAGRVKGWRRAVGAVIAFTEDS